MSIRDIGRPYEILWVEDNKGDVRLATEALKEAEAKVNLKVIGDGEGAIEYLRREGRFADVEKPDLVLLDLTLPRKDGLEVLEEIKNDEELRPIPVIVLTSSSANQDIFKAYETHANCFITKPTDLDKFFKVIQAIENFWFNIVELPRMD